MRLARKALGQPFAFGSGLAGPAASGQASSSLGNPSMSLAGSTGQPLVFGTSVLTPATSGQASSASGTPSSSPRSAGAGGQPVLFHWIGGLDAGLVGTSIVAVGNTVLVSIGRGFAGFALRRGYVRRVADRRCPLDVGERAHFGLTKGSRESGSSPDGRAPVRTDAEVNPEQSLNGGLSEGAEGVRLGHDRGAGRFRSDEHTAACDTDAERGCADDFTAERISRKGVLVRVHHVSGACRHTRRVQRRRWRLEDVEGRGTEPSLK